MYRSLLGLRLSTAPKSQRHRIAFASLLISGMWLFWLWRAVLISYFAEPNIILPFHNFEDLLYRSDKKVGKYNKIKMISFDITKPQSEVIMKD